MGLIKKWLSIFSRKKHHTYYTYELDLPGDVIESNRQEIISLLNSLDRKNTDKVIKYMEKNDFFNVPASISHHHNYRGGLAEHVLSVYHYARDYAPDQDGPSLIVACLLHDLCKTDLWHFQKDGGLRRNHGKSHRRGLKSIKILKSCGFELTESERRAIRWHMGGENAHTEEQEDADRARLDPLWQALFKANRHDSHK